MVENVIIRERGFKSAIMDSHQGNKVHKGGEIARVEPHNL